MASGGIVMLRMQRPNFLSQKRHKSRQNKFTPDADIDRMS